MAYFKVTVTGILLKNNTVAKKNEIVDENLLSTNAEKLVKEGFVKPATKTDLQSIKK